MPVLALSEKLPKWHFLLTAWSLNFLVGQLLYFDGVQNSFLGTFAK
jgi:hypothetical protein